MPKLSAGVVLYRIRERELQVFLVHPGGPFWKNKDEGAWSIPKGEYTEEEDAFEVAKREFLEETGFEVQGEFRELNMLRQPSGKRIRAWALQGDCDADVITSNSFSMEWPPRSGREAQFPEVDRAGWFGIDMAKEKILKGQRGFIEQLCELTGYPG
jgi:predicted NUDIX family NTP pyrophosphohydrolase